MFVRDAMSNHAEWIAPTTSIQEAARKMRDHAIGCLPVGDADRLVGMLTDRDLACRACADGADPKATKVSAIMTKGITWCFDDDQIDAAIRTMESKQIHHLPVLNRGKRLVGLLTLSDLATHASRETYPMVSKLAARDTGRHATQARH